MKTSRFGFAVALCLLAAGSVAMAENSSGPGSGGHGSLKGSHDDGPSAPAHGGPLPGGLASHGNLQGAINAGEAAGAALANNAAHPGTLTPGQVKSDQRAVLGGALAGVVCGGGCTH